MKNLQFSVKIFEKNRIVIHVIQSFRMNDKMIPLSEQYRINIKNAIELIDNTLELVKKSNVILSSKHLKEIRKAIAKKPYQKL